MPATPLVELSDAELRAVLAPLAAPDTVVANWAGAFVCRPRGVFEPATYDDCAAVLELARREGAHVRAIGVVHSPSDLALTDGYMIRMTRLNQVLEIDYEKRHVVVQGGIVLADLEAQLAAHGLGIRNCGSISEQTLAGVIATATHGSGLALGVMSTHVHALELMLPDGRIVPCSRAEDPELFLASLCGLGVTGLILSATLEVVPAFRLQEHQRSVPFDEAVALLPELAPGAEHFRAWWFPQADTVRLSMANSTTEPIKPAGSWLWDSLCGYHVIQFMLFIGRFIPAVTTWTARFAAWLVSAPSVGVNTSMKIFNVDCRYRQYTTEWCIPYENTQACLRELRDMLAGQLADPAGVRPHFPIEIRFTAADDIWLSPSAGQPSCWIGIVQYRPYGLAVPYRKLFALFEGVLLRHGGRPHWAKAHPLRPAQLRALYPRLDDFVRVLARVDPAGMLRNPYIERHFFGADGPAVADRVFKARA